MIAVPVRRRHGSRCPGGSGIDDRKLRGSDGTRPCIPDLLRVAETGAGNARVNARAVPLCSDMGSPSPAESGTSDALIAGAKPFPTAC